MAETRQMISEIVAKDINNNAPDYENNIRTKFPGYNLVFMFPTCPVENEKSIAFPAYVKKVTDSFTPTYQDQTVYGRMDPIPIYQRTKRTIQFDLDLPSNGLAQSMDIAKKLNILVRNLYPSYQKDGSVNIISSPPLVRIFFSNLIYDSFKTGGSLLGYFSSPVTITHDLEKGVFSKDQGYETYPRSYSMSFTFGVLHEYTPGYTTDTSGVISNPVNILGRK
jgi:hypothetical protein